MEGGGGYRQKLEGDDEKLEDMSPLQKTMTYLEKSIDMVYEEINSPGLIIMHNLQLHQGNQGIL